MSLVLIFALANSLVSSQTLTINQFFKSSLNDGYYKSFALQNSFLQDRKSYSLPWINQVQFRYQDNKIDDFQNRYGLRFDVGNPLQISRNNKYFQGIQSLKALEQKMVLKEILLERYEMVVEYWMAMDLAVCALKQKEIQEKIGYAIGQKSGSAGFDGDQYMNAQLNIISKEADWHEANFDRDVARSKILESGDAVSFDMQLAELIDVDGINQYVQGETQSASRTEFELMRKRVELSGLKLKLEKSNFDIGYLQTMYSAERQLGGENKLGVALGITIPLTKPNKENVAQEKLNVIERSGELEQFQFGERAKKLNSIVYLKLHLAYFQKLDSLITATKAKGMNQLTALANNFDPIIELKYQEKLIQFEVLKIKIKKEVLLKYVSYLDNADKLHERPLRNYLLKNLPTLEE